MVDCRTIQKNQKGEKMKELYLIRNLKGRYIHSFVGNEIVYSGKRDKALTFDLDFTHEALSFLRSQKQKVTFERVYPKWSGLSKMVRTARINIQ